MAFSPVVTPVSRYFFGVLAGTFWENGALSSVVLVTLASFFANLPVALSPSGRVRPFCPLLDIFGLFAATFWGNGKIFSVAVVALDSFFLATFPVFLATFPVWGLFSVAAFTLLWGLLDRFWLLRGAEWAALWRSSATFYGAH